MRESLQFYIDGQWVDPVELKTVDTINPANEEVSGRIALGSEADVDRAVQAARKAFPSWSQTTREERLALFERILAEYNRRAADLAEAITVEMGAPKGLAAGFQIGLGLGHLTTAIEVLKEFKFEELQGNSLIVKEPIGVCGLITPWNWPVNQVTVKVFPALATGCTIVLKASQESHYSALVLAEILDAAGVPAGVFNMIQGKGSVIGPALAQHPEVDLISITGSEAAGADVAARAASGIKRVCQELGGKGPNIILDDASFAANVAAGVTVMMVNSGQTCSSPSRMLVPNSRMADAIEAARGAITQVTVGDPNGDFAMGPVVSEKQFSSIQTLIHKGIEEGAELIAGGPGRPEGLDKGFYVKPTVFANVTNDMTIAREEIFGPVLVIIGYDDIDHAIEIANDTDFGLAGFVAGEDLELCRNIARRVRAGSLSINGGFDFHAPFGGYKKSGNGREWGEYGFHEYLEIKAILGYQPA